MNCGIPFCHQGCTVNNLIPDWNDLVYQNNWEEASQILSPHRGERNRSAENEGMIGIKKSA